jgi:hypothetical protein
MPRLTATALPYPASPNQNQPQHASPKRNTPKLNCLATTEHTRTQRTITEQNGLCFFSEKKVYWIQNAGKFVKLPVFVGKNLQIAPRIF